MYFFLNCRFNSVVNILYLCNRTIKTKLVMFNEQQSRILSLINYHNFYDVLERCKVYVVMMHT